MSIHLKSITRLLVALGLMAVILEVAVAQPLVNATRTIFLPQGPGDFGAPMNVAYHPGFDQYYASAGGNPGYQASVYNSSGGIVDSIDPINIDVRAWNYNPNTGLMEVVSYNAVAGGAGRGLIEAQLDGSGFYTGGTATLLATMPGNISSQTMPGYDSINDVFYSRDNGNAVNIVKRSDGTLSSSINLDTASAGSGTLTNYAIGVSAADGWLVVIDQTNDTAVVFDLAGSYVGTSALDITVDSSYGMGLANGQLFVWDDAQNGWQGYDYGAIGTGINNAPPAASPALPVPTMSWMGSIVLVAVLMFFAALVLRQRRRQLG